MATPRLLVLCLILAGCVTTPTAPVVDTAAAACAIGAGANGGTAAGEWLLGRWQFPYNTLVIRRAGAAIVYEWERAPGLVTERWGEKAPARGEGQVTRIAGCAVEMAGAYTWSTTQAIVGREMIYKLELTEPGRLQGQWYGAGRTWLRADWRRAG